MQQRYLLCKLRHIERVDQLAHVGLHGEIGGAEANVGLPRVAAKALGGGRTLLLAAADDDNVCTLPGQCFANGLAEAAGLAGDESSFVF